MTMKNRNAINKYRHPEYLPIFRPFVIAIATFCIAFALFNRAAPESAIGVVSWFAFTILPTRNRATSILALVILVIIGLAPGILFQNIINVSQVALLLVGVVIGLITRGYLIRVEWRMASEEVTNALTSLDVAEEKADDILKHLINYLRFYTRAEAIISVVEIDPNTATVITSNVPQISVGQLISPSIYATSIATQKPITYPNYAEASKPSHLLLANGIRALTIIPLNLRSDIGQGALLIGWMAPYEMCGEMRKFIDALHRTLQLVSRLQKMVLQLDYTRMRLQTILDTIPEGVIFVDESGSNGWTNGVAAELLGVKAGHTDPASIATAMTMLRSRVANPEAVARQAITYFSQPDVVIKDWIWQFDKPEELFLSLHSVPTQLRGVRGRLWLIKDVTTDYINRMRLLESEMRLRLMAEHATDIITTHKPNGEYTYSSPIGEKITGYGEDELLGRLPIEFMHPDDRKTVARMHRKLLEQASPTTFTFRWQHRDGHYIALESVMSAVRDPDTEEIIMLVGISRDVSARLEREQHEMSLRLERERSRLLATFVQDASHEFGTPLSVINTSLHLLGRTQDPDTVQRHVARLHDQSKRLSQLVNDLLTMVKLDSLKQSDMIMQPFKVEDVLADVMETTTPIAESRGLHLCQEALDGPLRIHGDYGLISKAVENLVDNALHYTPEGGEVTLRGRRLNQQIIIEVEDTGIGIPEELHGRIFDRFYRIDEARSTPGSGLGLSISRQIIEVHGGSISVESAPGKGTLFQIILPTSVDVGRRLEAHIAG